MIKRPLNARFSDRVLAGIKTTTIRDKAWPIGKPIMLYNWSEAAYRSKQIDIAPVIVTAATSIDISLGEFSDNVIFSEIMGLGRPLWQCEGFNGPLDMNDWFLPKMKSGQTVTKVLMRFRLLTDDELNPTVWTRKDRGRWTHNTLGELIRGGRLWHWYPPNKTLGPEETFPNLEEAFDWFRRNAKP